MVEDDLIAREHHEIYSRAVGKGLSTEDINAASKIIEQAQPRDIYRKHSEIPFVYEVLTTPGWREEVSALADRWVTDTKNIQRASTSVGRIAEKHGPDLVRAFCMFRLKAFNSSDWIPVSEGMSIDRAKNQTVVFVALVELNPSNGFFMPLEKGQDVCIDGNTVLRFPPCGGGVGLFICLNL
ncbi:hypothetical protein AAFC00_001977 [Neodothiora populina]|uniref:Uncharacterized protein n=1 Tax=Neodothiora populina TaxID=2781224 RepID=A0ABR3PRR5_9PEZI